MTIRTVLITIVFTIISNAVYADDQASVAQGAQGYDWQTCFDTKKGDCENACATSEDIDCKDNCDSMAKDKCESEGLYEPQ